MITLTTRKVKETVVAAEDEKVSHAAEAEARVQDPLHQGGPPGSSLEVAPGRDPLRRPEHTQLL